MVATLFAVAVGSVVTIIGVTATAGSVYALLYLVRTVKNAPEFINRSLPEFREGKIAGASLKTTDWLKREGVAAERTAEGLQDLQEFATVLEEAVRQVARRVADQEGRLAALEKALPRRR